MYKPPGIMFFNQTSTETNLKLPKTLIVLFFTLHSLYGFNFGFTKLFDKSVQVLFKLLSAVVFAVWIFCLVYPLRTSTFVFLSHKIFYMINLIEFVTFFLITNFSKVNLYEFMKRNNHNLQVIPKLQKESLGIKSAVYVFLVLSFKYFWCLILCVVLHGSWCDSFMLTDYLLDVSGISLDAISLLLVLITYFIHCYIKQFNQLASESETDILVKYYLNIADNYDFITPLYDRLIGTLLILEVPKLMMQVWGVLQFINLGVNWFVYVTYAVLAAHMMSRMIWPCIFTEMIKSQLESVKLTLHHRLLQETEAKKVEIQELLEYMSARSLKHSAWRMIPLDMNLPLFVLSTCVTYLIIIVQFSHLYDDANAKEMI